MMKTNNLTPVFFAQKQAGVFVVINKNEVLNKVGIKIFIIKEDDIKNDKKYIDNKKLEELLISIYSQIKPLENKKLS